MVIECSICFEALGNNSEMAEVATTCGHLFHRLCINNWLRQTLNCPNCRVAIRRTGLRQIYITNTERRESIMNSNEMQHMIRENQKLQKEKEQCEKEVDKLMKEFEKMKKDNEKVKRENERLKVQRMRNNSINDTFGLNILVPNSTIRNHAPLGSTNPRYRHIKSKVELRKKLISLFNRTFSCNFLMQELTMT